MRKYVSFVCLVPILFLTGCWSNMELTERAFVTAVALDSTEEGEIELTAQIYKPASEKGASSPQDGQTSFINIISKKQTIFEAIRNIAALVGRRAQFSHMQMIIIGEKLAKNGFSNILDFFFRDPEIRLNTHILIAKGKANDYIQGKSMIENTLGKQLEQQQIFSAQLTGMTMEITLLDLAFQMKSEVGSVMFPCISIDENSKKSFVGGIALSKEGKVVRFVPPKQTQYILMLADQYDYGIIDIPCNPSKEKEQKQYDTFEVTSQKTTTSLDISEDKVFVRLNVQIEGSIGELTCSSIGGIRKEEQFGEKLKKTVKQNLQAGLDIIQKEKIDVIGIGNQVYRQSPSYWFEWKPGWPERFARISFDIQVDVKISNSKMIGGKPIFSDYTS